MTDRPGDAPRPEPDDGTPVAPERETHQDDGSSTEATASDAGRPEVVASEVVASEVAASEVAAPAGYVADDEAGSVASTGRDERAAEDAPAGRDASAGPPAASDDTAVIPGTAPARYRPVTDPYETTRLPVTPPESDRPGGTRVGAALFFDDRLADPEPTLHPHDAPGHTLVDDAPTEAMAVVDPGGRHRAEPGSDADGGTDWRPPRQTSRVTVGLVAALLVVLGFLAGVLVGRTAAPSTASDQPTRPASTASARPGALR
jgi:hypothetical protein